MNNLAKSIGMNNTSFSNPVGRDSDTNYSTARDVATMLKYALKIAEFKRYLQLKNMRQLMG